MAFFFLPSSAFPITFFLSLSFYPRTPRCAREFTIHSNAAKMMLQPSEDASENGMSNFIQCLSIPELNWPPVPASSSATKKLLHGQNSWNPKKTTKSTVAKKTTSTKRQSTQNTRRGRTKGVGQNSFKIQEFSLNKLK